MTYKIIICSEKNKDIQNDNMQWAQEIYKNKDIHLCLCVRKLRNKMKQDIIIKTRYIKSNRLFIYYQSRYATKWNKI